MWSNRNAKTLFEIANAQIFMNHHNLNVRNVFCLHVCGGWLEAKFQIKSVLIVLSFKTSQILLNHLIIGVFCVITTHYGFSRETILLKIPKYMIYDNQMYIT